MTVLHFHAPMLQVTPVGTYTIHFLAFRAVKVMNYGVFGKYVALVRLSFDDDNLGRQFS